VTLLEQLGSSEARKLLEEYAKGDAGVLLTREARASLARLDNRRTGDE
jgi:hypothetical protein